jgi:hypothetical protein
MAPSAPLGVISSTDQSGLILILTALSLCFVLVSFAIRLYIRVPQKLWKWDDNVLTAATVLLTCPLQDRQSIADSLARYSPSYRPPLYSTKSSWALESAACSMRTRMAATKSRRYGISAYWEVSRPLLTATQYHFANDFMYLVVLFLSKLAVCFLFLRLTRRKEHITAIYSITGLCCVWFLLSILLVSIGSSWREAFSIPVGHHLSPAWRCSC